VVESGLSFDRQTFSTPHIENNKLLNTALFKKAVSCAATKPN
jgi:hypothetical protein